MKKYLLLLIPIILFSSCLKIMLKLYGVKNPGIENEKSILKKVKQLGLDTAHVVSVNSKDFLYQLKGARIPDGAIFDSAGNYIEYRPTDSTCNAGLFDFIPLLRKDSTFNKTGKTTLQTEYAKFRNLKGQQLAALPKADFYVLLYWAIWIGKLNKDHVKPWEQLAKQNKKCNIKVIKVNLDLQDYWEQSEKDRIIKAISKKKKK